MEEYAGIFRRRGGRVMFAELEAAQAERLRRNETELGLAEKPSKRDVDRSRRALLDADARWRLGSGGAFDGRPDWLRLDTTALPAAEAAARIVAHFGPTEPPAPAEST